MKEFIKEAEAITKEMPDSGSISVERYKESVLPLLKAIRDLNDVAENYKRMLEQLGG